MTTPICPGCDSELQSASVVICSMCHEQINPIPADKQPQTLKEAAWQPRVPEFARRIAPGQLSAWLTKAVDVDASQVGLLFENGAFKGELNPGREPLQTLKQRIDKLVSDKSQSAVLVRRGSFPLVFSGRCGDDGGNEIRFSCEVGVRYDNADQFYVELMQSHDVLVSGQLLKLLGPHLRQGIATFAAQRPAGDLVTPHPELQQRMTDELGDAMEAAAARLGLVISYVSPVQFALGKDAAEFQRKRSAYIKNLRSETLDLKLEQKRHEIQVQRYVLLRERNEKNRKAAQEELDRDAHYRELRRGVEFRLNVNKLELEEQFNAKTHELFERSRSRTEDNENHDRARQQSVAKTELQFHLESSDLKLAVASKQIASDHQLDDLQREQAMKVAEESQRAELQLLEESEAAQLQRWSLETDTKRSHLLKDANVQAEIQDVARDSRARDYNQDMLELEAALGIKARAQELKHARKTNELELQQQSEDAAHRREEESKDAEHRRGLEQSEALKDSPKLIQLMAMADTAGKTPAMAEAFAKAMQMGMAEDVSADKLLALAAEKSPQAAAALETYFKSRSPTDQVAQQDNAQLLAQIEKLETKLDSEREYSREQMNQFVAELKELNLHTSEMFRDVAVANAGNSSGSQTPAAPSAKDMLAMLKELKGTFSMPVKDA